MFNILNSVLGLESLTFHGWETLGRKDFFPNGRPQDDPEAYTDIPPV